MPRYARCGSKEGTKQVWVWPAGNNCGRDVGICYTRLPCYAPLMMYQQQCGYIIGHLIVLHTEGPPRCAQRSGGAYCTAITCNSADQHKKAHRVARPCVRSSALAAMEAGSVACTRLDYLALPNGGLLYPLLVCVRDLFF